MDKIERAAHLLPPQFEGQEAEFGVEGAAFHVRLKGWVGFRAAMGSPGTTTQQLMPSTLTMA